MVNTHSTGSFWSCRFRNSLKTCAAGKSDTNERNCNRVSFRLNQFMPSKWKLYERWHHLEQANLHLAAFQSVMRQQNVYYCKLNSSHCTHTHTFQYRHNLSYYHAYAMCAFFRFDSNRPAPPLIEIKKIWTTIMARSSALWISSPYDIANWWRLCSSSYFRLDLQCCGTRKIILDSEL